MKTFILAGLSFAALGLMVIGLAEGGNMRPMYTGMAAALLALVGLALPDRQPVRISRVRR